MMEVYPVVADPYRENEERRARRVVATRGRAAVAGYIGLALAGLATPLLARQWGDEYPSLIILAFVAFPAGLFALGRGLHACFVPHVVETDSRGLHFAWGSKVTCMPWLRREDREVPWSALRRVETRTFSVNGIATTSLLVTTDDGAFEMPDRGFGLSAHEIQRAILDHIERRRERPVGAISAYAQACRQRFTTPDRLVASPRGIIGAFAFFVPFMVFPVWLATATPFWLTYGFAALAVLLFGGLSVLGFWGWWSHRILELGPEGLAIGPSIDRARRIPWDTIRTVRRSVINGKTDGIEIVQDDGTRITVRQNYGRRLEDLARSIDPNAVVPVPPSS